MNAPEQQQLIGAAVKRKEDYRFLTGAGQYTDDVVLPQQSYGVFLRSPHAHAKIRSIDIAAAKTVARRDRDFHRRGSSRRENVGGLPCGWLIHSTDGKPMHEPPHPVIAHDKVRHVGDQVALVVAESVKEAKDALELIEVDYDVLPAAVDTASASDAGPAARARRRAEQRLLQLGPRRQGEDRRRVRAGRARDDARYREPAPRAERDRAARRERELFEARRQLHGLCREPESARRAPADGGVRAVVAGIEAARDRAGRRRRLRLEDFPVSRRTSR